MKAFNLAYYWKHVQRVRRGILHPDAFFYPLDMLDDWNLIYGRRGFTQYQCVLPHADDNGPARRFLELFVSGGGMGFLCVIKDCGAEGKGMLSFPRPGMSIAMDFPIHPDENAGPGRSAQRIGDRRGRADLPDEGHVHPAGAFSRHGAAAGGVQRGAPPVGPAGPHPQRPIGPTLGRPRMKAVLFGASKGMGRALARLLAARGDRLFLLEHVVEDLERSARDLEIHGAPGPVGTAYCDLLQPDSFAPALDQAQRELGGFDTVVVTAGLFATQEELENDPQLAARLLAADFTNTVLFCEEARKRLLGRLAGRPGVRTATCVRRHALRVQFRGGRAGPEAGDPLRRGESGALAIPGGAGPQVPRPRTEDRLREAGLREDRHDGRPEAAAVCRHAGGGCPAGAAGHRPRLARGLRAPDVALGDVRDPQAAAVRDAKNRVLRGVSVCQLSVDPVAGMPDN